MRNSLLTPWLLIPLFLGIPDAIAAQNAKTTHSSAPDTVVGWYTGSSERSTLSLVYSCLITTFACTWTVLHLNVPALGESSWTRFIRKAKWMAITILLPEFIFSKAVCGLRLALKDLHAFDKRLREKYPGGLGCRDLVKHKNSPLKSGLFRQWRVKYSAFVLFLFPLFGLPRPDTQTCIPRNANGMEHLHRAEVDGEAIVEGPSIESMDHNSRPPSRRSPDEGEPSTNREQEVEQRACSPNLAVGMAPTSIHQAHGPTIPVLNPKRPHSVPSRGDSNLETYEQGRRCQSLPNVHREYTHNAPNRTVIETGGDTQNESGIIRRYVGSSELRPPRTIHEWQDWTLAHSFLANMGGIIHGYTNLFNKEIKYTVLTGNKLCHFSWGNKHPLEQLVLSQEDIADRSKADWFLRALAVLQISWLVLTVIARHVSSLPLTQLELATSAFSVFAVATYAVNWWKPKDISQPIRLLGYSDGVYDKHSEPTQSIVFHFRSPAAARDQATRIMDTCRVENDVVELQGRLPLIFQLMAFAAFMFGGIHCLAWNFAFPSRAEAILWRTASIASAIVPILPLAASIVANHVITVAERDALLSLKSKLSGFADFPSSYVDLLTNPGFMRWNSRSCMALFCKPPEKRDFSHEPSEEEMNEVEEPPVIPSFKFEEGTRGVLHSIQILFLWWKGETRYSSSGILVALEHELRYSGFVENFLIDYENSFVKTKAPLARGMLSKSTMIHYIVNDVQPVLRDQCRKVWRTKDICELISSFSMIVCGTFYIAARVIIIVLLFTSLREVPLGVYQETPWTRFLPSFS